MLRNVFVTATMLSVISLMAGYDWWLIPVFMLWVILLAIAFEWIFGVKPK